MAESYHQCEAAKMQYLRQRNDCIRLTKQLIRALDNDTGAEPSVSVLGRATDEAREFVRLYPEVVYV